MRTAAWVSVVAAALVGVAVNAQAGDGGLITSANTDLPTRWQTRMTVGFHDVDRGLAQLQVRTPGLNLHSASVMGDYYFVRSEPDARTQGGFRATGGVVLANGLGAFAGAAQQSSSPQRDSVNRYALAGSGVDGAGLQAMPYVGVGYTAHNSPGGWGFSADVGVVTQGIKADGAMFSSFGLDERWREMRMAPLLQLGVSYSF